MKNTGPQAFFYPDEEYTDDDCPENQPVENLTPRDHKSIIEEYRRLALGVVLRDGLALENYPGLDDDEEIVLAAISQNAEAFKLASDRLKESEKIFIAAVKKDINVNIYGPRKLRARYQYSKI